ncbi:MAG: NAD(P)-dependent alcohol dehydrogenase, partial [Spirochaetales bacterium]
SPTSSGTYAEKIVVPESLVVKIPEALSYPEAASLPLTSLTAFQSLFVHGRIAPGAHVLINGAAGGVGVSAVQLAKVGRARVIAVASSRNQSLCEELGADYFLDYNSRHPLSRVAEPYDLIFDAVDALDRREALAALSPGGMLITLDPGLKAMYSSLLSRRTARKHVIEIVKPDGRHLGRIADHVAARRMRAVVEDTIPIAEVERAWRRSMAGHVAGKLVLDTR